MNNDSLTADSLPCPHGYSRRRKCIICDNEDEQTLIASQAAHIAELEQTVRALMDGPIAPDVPLSSKELQAIIAKYAHEPSADRMPCTHELKVSSEFFPSLCDGSKPFEVRKNDRDYQVGDRLYLNEILKESGEYTSGQVAKVITYVLRGPAFGIAEGYAVLGLTDPPPDAFCKALSVEPSAETQPSNNSLATSLREFAEEVREAAASEVFALLTVDLSFADILDVAAQRLTGEPSDVRPELVSELEELAQVVSDCLRPDNSPIRDCELRDIEKAMRGAAVMLKPRARDAGETLATHCDCKYLSDCSRCNPKSTDKGAATPTCEHMYVCAAGAKIGEAVCMKCGAQEPSENTRASRNETT